MNKIYEETDIMDIAISDAEDAFKKMFTRQLTDDERMKRLQNLRTHFVGITGVYGLSRSLVKIQERINTIDLLLDENGYTQYLSVLKAFLLAECIRINREIQKKSNVIKI